MGIFNIPTPEELEKQKQKQNQDDLDSFITTFSLDLSQEEIELFSKVYKNTFSLSQKSKNKVINNCDVYGANANVNSLLLDFYILNELSANNRNANSIDEKLSILIEQNNQIIELLKKTKNQ